MKGMDVRNAVESFYQVNIRDKTRFRCIARPRQVAMYLCRKHTNLSYRGIAILVGLTDHTTVIHGVKKIEELCKNEKFKQQIEGIL